MSLTITGNPVALYDTQHAGKEIVTRPMSEYFANDPECHDLLPCTLRSHRVVWLGGGCPTGPPVGGVTSTSTPALWAGVKCEVRGGKMRGTGANVIGRWLAGHLALYPTVITLHRQQRLSLGGLLNGNRRPLGCLASPSLHITSTTVRA